MRVLLLAVACIGCGRIHFETRDALAVDTLVEGPFSPAVPIAELNSSFAEDDVSLTTDLLEIYFLSARSGTEQLWRSTRASVDDPWPPPSPIDELNADGDVNNARVTPDGLAIYFASRRLPNAGGSDLWVSTRPDRASVWSPPRRIDELATTGADFEPWALNSRLVIYFARAGPDVDLYRAERAAETEPFGPATRLDGVSAPGYDGGPWVDESERLLMFHSSRGPDTDILVATRGSTSEPFANPLPHPDVTSAAYEQDVWQSPDGRTFVFVSDRSGNDDLYIATR